MTAAWIFLKRPYFYNPFWFISEVKTKEPFEKVLLCLSPVNFLSTQPPNKNSFLYSSKQSFFGTVGEESLKPLTVRFSFVPKVLLLISLALFRESLRGLPQH